jgi:hypothetical protein
MDIMTTEGSFSNKFDFLDADGREKSLVGTALKVAIGIAPFLIPEFGVFKGMASIPSLYGSINAAINLSTTMPTFYKSLEGILLGDTNSSLTNGATKLEGWMAKYAQSSISDEGSNSLFSVEQMSSMVSSIFSQIYEQRAAAGLSTLFYKGDKLVNAKAEQLLGKINTELLQEAIAGKIDFKDIGALSKAAAAKLPELQSVIKAQSQMSKALSLGYMALTSTGDIYGQAIEGGYDRRTAGFAALTAASGQYAIMMNNKMGDWFLDKSTGYSLEANKALMKKSITPWFDEIAAGFNKIREGSTQEGKKALSSTFVKMKNSIVEIFTTPSVVGEAM